MARSFSLALVLALFMASGCSSSPAVPPLSIGSLVDFSLLEDQRGNAFTHQATMSTVFFVNTMKGNALMRDTLKEINVTCLQDGRVVYLADISGMPGLIASLVAIPRMRDYPYPVWLDRNGLATSALPVEDDTVTVLTVKQAAITAVVQLKEGAALRQRLLDECGPALQQVASHDVGV